MKSSGRLKIFLLLLMLVFSAASSIAQKSNAITDTKFKKYVVDETGTLTSSQVQDLNDKLYKFDQETTNQVIVYIISTLGDESLEDISVRLAEKNKIGKKDRNNGVLLLVVKNDRQLRIEVGYGLEGVLTDALSSQIIRKDITPSFKSGNYYEGIVNGVNSIISVTKNEYAADPKEKKGSGGSISSILIIIFIFGFIIFSIIIGIIKRVSGVGKRFYSGSSGFGGFWGGGSGSSGSSGGSWGGGGGFSGGGGSFGGGGASGSW